jgi:hypothetical protein
MSGSNSSVRAAAPEGDAPLTFSVHSMPRPEVDDAVRRTARGRRAMLLVLAICAAPVIASYVAYFFVRPEARTNYATLVEPLRPIPPALPLADLQGKRVEAASLRGNWTLVVVGGGACDAPCETHLWQVRQLREALGRDKDRLDKLWLIDDGATPRPELLASIGAGAPTRVLRVDRPALAQWLEPEPGRTLAQHLYVVDPLGNWMMRTPADVDASRFKRDLERLMRASASWQPLRR